PCDRGARGLVHLAAGSLPESHRRDDPRLLRRGPRLFPQTLRLPPAQGCGRGAGSRGAAAGARTFRGVRESLPHRQGQDLAARTPVALHLLSRSSLGEGAGDRAAGPANAARILFRVDRTLSRPWSGPGAILLLLQPRRICQTLAGRFRNGIDPTVV